MRWLIRNSPSSLGQRRAYLWLIVPVFAMGLLVWAISSPKKEQTLPPFSIRYTGETSPGIHRNPFGHFVLSNQWHRTLRWGRNAVEAPLDPDIGWSAGCDSMMCYGTLRPGASTNFPGLIPHTKGVPFRMLIGYAPEERFLDRVRERLPDPLPIIDRIWPPNRFCTFTSQWFYATADSN